MPYATPEVRKELQIGIDGMQAAIDNPEAYRKIQKKDQFKARLESEKARLKAMTPPDTTGAEKRAIQARLSQLEEAIVKGAEMPNDRQMEEAPAGAVGQHLTWQNYIKKHALTPDGKPTNVGKDNRSIFIEWKDLRRTLFKEQEGENPDIANIDILRPSGTVPLADSVLPRSYGLSAQAKINYDEVFEGREPTAVEKKLQDKKG